MNISKVNEWLTLTANIGVLLGIFFLATELQQANRIALRDARTDVLQSASEVAGLILESPELASLRAKLRDANPELTASEREQAHALAGKLSAHWAIVNAAYDTGLLTDSALEGHVSGSVAQIRNYPGLRPYIRQQLQNLSAEPGEYGPVYDAIFLELE